MKLTDEQAFAVGERSGPLFLSAGAGSGKTRVLVERFVRAVCDDDVPVERVLAITFTEKAAAELKARLRARFTELGEREHARAAEGAWIGTIHGFCARLLRAHALAAGLDPEYAVLEESDASRLAIAAFDRALGDFMRDASDTERLDLVASYTPDKLRTMVRTVHAQRRSQGFREPALPDPPVPPEAGGEREALERALAAAQAELGAEEPKPMVLRAIGKLDACAAALALVPPGVLGEPGEFTGAVVKPGNVKALQGPALERYLDALGDWVGLCSAHRAAAQYRHVKRLLEHYSVRYEDAKRERSALDFEDLELIARDLLKQRPEIQALWRERFLHVMVDEYQDTNALQDELLDLTAGERLFAVGDDRQSIYGFRHADVEGFRARRDAAVEAGRAARLDVNFRSAPAVLEAINVAFTDVWGDDYTPLRPGLEPDAEASVEMLIVAKKGWDDVELGDDPFGPSMHGATTWRAAEARLLAARIESLVAADASLGYGDVAMLMRAATDMPLYERALTERGIPTYAAGSRGYFSQQQIADLRAYLAALANPLDGVALYSLLASPLVGVSLDGLTALRLEARAQQRDPWWVLERFAVHRSPFTVHLPAADAERLNRFVPRFAAERRAAPRLSLETVVDRAITWTGYDRVVLAMPAGERRMANVRKLMRLAREFERVGGRDLRRFIDYVDEQELIAAREGEAPLETESLAAVRLMTIHAAKGLEFPVVAVADMGRAGRADDTPLRVSPDGRVGLELASLAGRGAAALDLDTLKREEEDRAEAEERRVFYVAMTRAERHLILSGATDTDKWSAATALGAPMDWAWRAFSRELPELLDSAAEATVAVGTTPVRCVICSPATVDAALPAADRIPVRALDEGAARETLERPAFPAVQPPVSLPLARLSYTALEGYARCGYRFYLERVARLREWEWREAPSDPAIGDLVPSAGADEVGPDARPPDLFALATVGGDDQLGLPLDAALSEEPRPRGTLTAIVRGSIVHTLLEGVDPQRPAAPGPEAVEAQLDAYGLEVLQEDVDDITSLIEAWVGSSLAERVRAARRVRQELQFAFPLAVGGEGFLVNGVIDVHADEDGGALVVDYKSDRLEGADPVAYTEEHYATQRIVYALAALRGEAERVEVIHAFLERLDEPVSAIYERADMPALEEQLRGLAAGVIAGRFEVSDDPHRDLCRGCPGRVALCKWDESRTTAPKALA